jgi:glycosyltransferase involved in cell wall biosynthesis
MARERTTVAHLHTFASHVVGTRAALRAGAAVLRTEHSSRVYTTPTCWPFSRWSLERTDAVVAISNYLRRTIELKAPFAVRRLHVIGNGVDTSRFSPLPREDDGERPFQFVLVARLEPRKGVDLALEALAQVPGARLDVVGDGGERGKLMRRASALHLDSRVRFHGFLDDPRPRMGTADAAIASSADEGLGLGLLECMALGVPVVGVPVGGIPEVVQDGVNGWLAGERTAAALARAMRISMASVSRARAKGARARAWVEQKFSLQAMAAGYGRIYEKLHASRAGRAKWGLA